MFSYPASWMPWLSSATPRLRAPDSVLENHREPSYFPLEARDQPQTDLLQLLETQAQNQLLAAAASSTPPIHPWYPHKSGQKRRLSGPVVVSTLKVVQRNCATSWTAATLGATDLPVRLREASGEGGPKEVTLSSEHTHTLFKAKAAGCHLIHKSTPEAQKTLHKVWLALGRKTSKPSVATYRMD